MAFKKAIRERVFIKPKIVSPCGGGKTYSALRLDASTSDDIEDVEKHIRHINLMQEPQRMES